MTDLEMTKLCAEAMQEDSVAAREFFEEGNRGGYEPLYDDAQAMELFKRFIVRCGKRETGYWWVEDAHGNAAGLTKDLNRAIVECVANGRAAK